jgi:hypothetical protein
VGCACKGTLTKPGYPAVQAYLACAKAPQLNTISDADMLMFVHAVGTNDSSLCYVAACLYAGRLLYGKNNVGLPPSGGDCGSQSSISLGPASLVTKTAGLAGAGLGASAGVATLVGSSAALGIGEAASIVGLAALPFTIWGVFGAEHAAAVQKEQTTLCSVAVAYNTWATAIEAQIQSGKVSAADASAASDAVVTQLVEAMQSIRKTCNFACGMTYAVKALGNYNKAVRFPALVSPTAAVLNSVGLGSLASTLGGNSTTWLIIAAVAAYFLLRR